MKLICLSIMHNHKILPDNLSSYFEVGNTEYLVQGHTCKIFTVYCKRKKKKAATICIAYTLRLV